MAARQQAETHLDAQPRRDHQGAPTLPSSLYHTIFTLELSPVYQGCFNASVDEVDYQGRWPPNIKAKASQLEVQRAHETLPAKGSPPQC